MASAAELTCASYRQKVFLDAVRCGDTLRLRRLLQTDLPDEGCPTNLDRLVYCQSRHLQPKCRSRNVDGRLTTSPSLSQRSLVCSSPVNVNLYSADGQTALHQCCQDGDFEMVQLLVRHGADVRLANRDGWSALHIAVGAGRQDIARFLLKAHQR